MDDRSTWTCFRCSGTCTLLVFGVSTSAYPAAQGRLPGRVGQMTRRWEEEAAAWQVLKVKVRPSTTSTNPNTCKAGGERTPRSSGLKNYITVCVTKNDKKVWCSKLYVQAKIQSNDMPAVDVLLRSRIVLVDWVLQALSSDHFLYRGRQHISDHSNDWWLIMKSMIRRNEGSTSPYTADTACK